MGAPKAYVPVLRFAFLTKLFDPLINVTMPEKAFRKKLIEQSQIGSYQRVLDYGCGTATLSIMLKQTHPTTIVEGVDVDLKVLEIARKKALEANTKVRLIIFDGSQLPYPDECFDRVLSSLVFHHLEREEKMQALSEIHRVLKPGGTLNIADFGKPQNMAMRIAIHSIGWLDGIKRVRDNVKGLLPEFMIKAGFIGVAENDRYATLYGTLSLYQAKKGE